MQEDIREIRLILGDQLNEHHPWFQGEREGVLYTMMEIRTETDYVDHHIQKVLLFFSAMRAFAGRLEKRGFKLRYFNINAPDNEQDFAKNLQKLTEAYQVDSIRIQLPDEYRLDQYFRNLKIQNVRIEFDDSHHFLGERHLLEEHFKGKKTYLMESFYRMMRKKYDVLMEGDQPLGDRWNFDQQNRNALPEDRKNPEPKLFEHNLSDLLEEIKDAGVNTIGEVDAVNFVWPVDREEALVLLQFFTKELLQDFGTYQDSLTDRGWSLFHSRLSAAMNLKMISPLEVIQAVENAYRKSPEIIDLAQAEGFIRQILGWREFMRGVYWAKMPEFAEMNFFNHQSSLPDFFWTGDTKMACVKQAVDQSLEFAYAHHIQRLMVTGNFALLAGVHPDEIDRWYLGIYIDALEWVEITNTRGMSQFADGGIVGTKPYVSSANYLAKMGDHCKSCSYDAKKRVGEGACPFNSLYWHFHHRHRSKLEKNARIGMVYRTWDRMKEDKKQALLETADQYLSKLDQL